MSGGSEPNSLLHWQSTAEDGQRRRALTALKCRRVQFRPLWPVNAPFAFDSDADSEIRLRLLSFCIFFAKGIKKIPKSKILTWYFSSRLRNIFRAS